MNFKDFLLNFFGIFYIIIAIIAFYNSITNIGYSSVLWFSYFAFLITGIGILMRNSFLIGSQLNIIFIPYLIWTVDFLYKLITSKSLWGITDYVFLQTLLLPKLITIQHVFLIPISLICIYFIKFRKKNFWKISIIQVFVIFFLTRVFSNPAMNINCAFKNCLPFSVNEPAYFISWILAYVFMIFVTNLILAKIKAFDYR